MQTQPVAFAGALWQVFVWKTQINKDEFFIFPDDESRVMKTQAVAFVR